MSRPGGARAIKAAGVVHKIHRIGVFQGRGSRPGMMTLVHPSGVRVYSIQVAIWAFLQVGGPLQVELEHRTPERDLCRGPRHRVTARELAVEQVTFICKFDTVECVSANTQQKAIQIHPAHPITVNA